MMKTRIFVLASMLALMLVAGAPALADGVTGVTVSPLTPKPDETITVNGEVLGPNSQVEVRLIGSGVDEKLGEAQADETGDFTKEFRLPANLKPGTYQIQAAGAETATTQITVQEGPAGSAVQEEQASEPAAEDESEAAHDEEAAAEEEQQAGADEQAAADEQAVGEEDAAAQQEMGAEPVIETRPLGQSIGLVALFGVLAALGLLFAHMPVRRKKA
jgi:hypothetical protein